MACTPGPRKQQNSFGCPDSSQCNWQKHGLGWFFLEKLFKK